MKKGLFCLTIIAVVFLLFCASFVRADGTWGQFQGDANMSASITSIGAFNNTQNTALLTDTGIPAYDYPSLQSQALAGRMLGTTKMVLFHSTNAQIGKPANYMQIYNVSPDGSTLQLDTNDMIDNGRYFLFTNFSIGAYALYDWDGDGDDEIILLNTIDGKTNLTVFKNIYYNGYSAIEHLYSVIISPNSRVDTANIVCDIFGSYGRTCAFIGLNGQMYAYQFNSTDNFLGIFNGSMNSPLQINTTDTPINVIRNAYISFGDLHKDGKKQIGMTISNGVSTRMKVRLIQSDLTILKDDIILWNADKFVYDENVGAYSFTVTKFSLKIEEIRAGYSDTAVGVGIVYDYGLTIPAYLTKIVPFSSFYLFDKYGEPIKNTTFWGYCMDYGIWQYNATAPFDFQFYDYDNDGKDEVFLEGKYRGRYFGDYPLLECHILQVAKKWQNEHILWDLGTSYSYQSVTSGDYGKPNRLGTVQIGDFNRDGNIEFLSRYGIHSLDWNTSYPDFYNYLLRDYSPYITFNPISFNSTNVKIIETSYNQTRIHNGNFSLAYTGNVTPPSPSNNTLPTINSVAYTPALCIDPNSTLNMLISATDPQNDTIGYAHRCSASDNMTEFNSTNSRNCFYLNAGNYSNTIYVNDTNHTTWNSFAQIIEVKTNYNPNQINLPTEITVRSTEAGKETSGLLPEIYFGTVAFFKFLPPLAVLGFIFLAVMVILAVGFILQGIMRLIVKIGS